MWLLGQGDVRNGASGIGVAGRSGEGNARSKHECRSVVAVCFYHRNDVDGSGLVHADDFVIVTRRYHAKEAFAQKMGRGGARIFGQDLMTERKAVSQTES